MNQWSIIRSSTEHWEGEFPVHEPQGEFLHLILTAESPVNALSSSVLEELEALEPELRAARNVTALFLWSGHAEHWIAGADIDEIASIDDPATGREASARGQRIFGGLAALPYPTVAVIHGTCLGGGLELALALDYRVAVDTPGTRIGLPEVNLGIIPGFGGTQRLPRLVGLRTALDVILSARRLPARAAHSKGIVDAVIPPEGYRTLAVQVGRKLVARGPGALSKQRRRGGPLARLMEGSPPGRALIAKMARKQVSEKTGGHYPAPFAALDSVVRGVGGSLEDGLAREARLCGELIAGDVSRNLISVFQTSEQARRLRIEGTGSAGDWPHPGFVGVLGAGVMGAGIASLLLEKGIETRLRDLDPEALGRGLAFIGKRIGRHAHRRRLCDRERDALLGRLTYTTDLQGFGRVDAVIEAIVERLDIKKRALAELEPCLPSDALFATNTSALSVTALAEGARHPERVVGLHFFNPVHRMPLVEVIPGRDTADWATSRAVRLSQQLGKYPVVVKDSPGFLVNRLLLPYLDSACRLLERGIPGPQIDRAAVAFGLPMGPFRLLDEVGIDIAGEVAGTLHAAFGQRAEPAPLLGELLDRELLGRKGGRGFYLYDGDEVGAWNDSSVAAPPSGESMSDSDLVDYLLDRLIDEAARCLEEEVIELPAMVDLAMVMGTGFPPFRGGPLRHADRQGLPGVVERLNRRVRAGEHCAPSALLESLAGTGGHFHDLRPQYQRT